MRRAAHLTLPVICGLVLFGSIVTSSANAQTPWLGDEWKRRIPFTVTEGSVPGGTNLTNFTMLLELNASEFGPVFANADTTGQELTITAGDGTTELDLEVVTYDHMGQTAEIWFEAATLSDVDDSFFLYYDFQPDPEELPAFRFTPGAAWGPEYLLVYHFAEDPSFGTLKDWGPNARDATAAVKLNPVGPGWTSANQVAGVAGTGWEFDGDELWAYAENVSSADSSFTITSWFANSQIVDKGAMAFQAPLGRWNLSFQRTEGDKNGDIETLTGGMSWLPDILDGDMHSFTWTLDAESDTVRFYFDGIERDFWFRYTPPGEDGPVWTGETIDGRVGIISPASYNNLDVADGVADEFRLIEGVRTADWIAIEYLNQSDPVAFFNVGSEELFSGGPTGIGDPLAAISPLGAITVSPNPFRGVAQVSVETSRNDVTVQVYDVRGRLVKTLGQWSRTDDTMLRFLWDGKDAGGTEVSNGIYYIQARSGALVATGKAMRVR